MRTELLPYPGGHVEYGVVGTPDRQHHTTLFLHGLAGSIDDARPLASGVPGRKVFAHLPGHGRSTGPDPLTYDTLAAAAEVVADHEHVRAALGISLGAATLLRILAATPDRFERVVLYLPAVVDVPRAPEAVAPHHLLADRLAAGDPDGVARALLGTQPEAVRGTSVATEWAARRAGELLAELAGPSAGSGPATGSGRSGESGPLAGSGLSADHDSAAPQPPNPRRLLPLASAVPLPAPASGEPPLARLQAVKIPVLVVAQEGDPAHPVAAARRVADALPAAELAVFDARGALWGHRRELRELLVPFLAGDIRSVTSSP